MLLAVGLTAVLGAAWWFSSRAVDDVRVEPGEPVKPAPPIARPPAPPPRGDDGQPAPMEVPPAPTAPESAAPVTPPPSFVPGPSSTPRPPKHPIDPVALAKETELLQRARAVLASDPELSLRRLTEHRQQFPEGALQQDAELIRLEAFLRLGRRDDAAALGKKLIGTDRGTRKAVNRLLEETPPN